MCKTQSSDSAVAGQKGDEQPDAVQARQAVESFQGLQGHRTSCQDQQHCKARPAPAGKAVSLHDHSHLS